MLLLNFSHPLTDTQLHQIEASAQAPITRTLDIAVQFDEQDPFVPQLQQLLASVSLTPAQWQNEALVVVLPSLNFIAAALLAELHGRIGYFPAIVRTRPVAGATLRRYEVAELLDLQAIREQARAAR